MSGSRYDAKSSKIQIASYRGATLQGPTATISRKIFANESYLNESTTFNSTAFRILGTASGSLMKAKVYLVCPLSFNTAVGQTYPAAEYHVAADVRQAAVGPRRNGLWKAIAHTPIERDR